jgi:hypothetical protein
MTHEQHPRWWRYAAVFALLLALVLLAVPQAQHGHTSLLFAVLVPVLWVFSAVVTQRRDAFVNERVLPLGPALPLPSLSHLPPPATLA